MTPTTPNKLLSMSSPDSSPSRLPIRQKGSLLIPDLPTLTLPSLPDITNPAIKNLALTHSSNHAGQSSRKRDLIYNQAEAVLDNEKLEHVGDGLLTAAVITLLHELYPAFGPGPATYLRGHMVSNRSLAQISEQYGLPEMFIANASSKYMIQAAQKAKGSLFEAYVAGVYYSYLMPREEAESEGSGGTVRPKSSDEDTPEQEVNDGLSGIHSLTSTPPQESNETNHIKGEQNKVDTKGPSDIESGKPNPTALVRIDDLFSLGLKSRASGETDSLTPSTPTSPTPSITSPARSNYIPRTHGQAFDHLCSWLWPLFTPIAHFLSSYLESESSLKLINTPSNPNQVHNVPNEWKEEDTMAIGSIGALNQYLGKTYGCGYLPTWITKKRVMDVWRMVCIVRTPEGKECRAEGKRLTKKAAMTVAAFKVWNEVKAHEEEQAELRRAAEAEEDSEEGEEEVMLLKEKKPREKQVEGEDDLKEKQDIDEKGVEQEA